MAETGAFYDATPVPHKAADILTPSTPESDAKTSESKPAPTAKNTWLTASFAPCRDRDRTGLGRRRPAGSRTRKTVGGAGGQQSTPDRLHQSRSGASQSGRDGRDRLHPRAGVPMESGLGTGRAYQYRACLVGGGSAPPRLGVCAGGSRGRPTESLSAKCLGRWVVSVVAPCQPLVVDSKGVRRNLLCLTLHRPACKARWSQMRRFGRSVTQSRLPGRPSPDSRGSRRGHRSSLKLRQIPFGGARGGVDRLDSIRRRVGGADRRRVPRLGRAFGSPATYTDMQGVAWPGYRPERGHGCRRKAGGRPLSVLRALGPLQGSLSPARDTAQFGCPR